MATPIETDDRGAAPLARATERGIGTSVWKQAQEGHLATWRRYAAEGRRADASREATWRAILACCEARAPLTEGERVLDIGCGLDTVLDFVPGVRGFTLDSLMHALSEFELTPALHHSAGAMEQLPFPDDSFDRVFLMNVLDHVLAPHAGVHEIARVVRPGGVLVLSVDTYEGRRYLQKRARKWYDRKRGASTKHPWVFSRGSVAALLRAAGFAPGDAVHVEGTKERRSLFVARRAQD